MSKDFILCPPCEGHGMIEEITIKHTGEIIYVCDECEETWFDKDQIEVATSTRLGTFAERSGWNYGSLKQTVENGVISLTVDGFTCDDPTARSKKQSYKDPCPCCKHNCIHKVFVKTNKDNVIYACHNCNSVWFSELTICYAKANDFARYLMLLGYNYKNFEMEYERHDNIRLGVIQVC